MTVDHLRTHRLALERMGLAHMNDMVAMWSDPAVAACLGGVRDPVATAEWMKGNIAHWERRGWGFWAALDPADGSFVGYLGLLERDLLGGVIEMSYGLVPAHWGRGLAQELARAVVGDIAPLLPIDVITSLILTTNAASRHVVEKIGFEWERQVLHQGLVHDVFRYRVRTPAVLG